MLISIIIPTRDRAEVLKYSLASCVRIRDSEIEIVVSDNSSVDDTPNVVAKFKDARIRYVRTPQRCSMRQNFEFAVCHASGDYIFILGDDDALIPNQFPYLRSLLERFTPDTMTGAIVKYAWPSPVAYNGGRIKLQFKSLYGIPAIVSGEQLRSDLERRGALIARYAPRIYGGVASRRVVEGLKAKTGELFMASSPDTYFIFASPSQIQRHLVVSHPFFVAGSSSRSNGASYFGWQRDGAPPSELNKFFSENSQDPVHDIVPVTASLPLDMLSCLEAANRYAYGGKLRVDYEREAGRVIGSLSGIDRCQREAAAGAFAEFASARNLPAALCDPKALLARCGPAVKPPGSPPALPKVRSYLSVGRISLDLSGSKRTDVDAAAATYEHLIGQRADQRGLLRWLAWARLLLRALPLITRPPRRRNAAQDTSDAVTG